MKLRFLALSAALLLASCSVQTGDSGSDDPSAPPTVRVCGSAHGDRSPCVSDYCASLGATRESYDGVTFCHARDTWLEYTTIAMAENQSETRAAQLLVNPRAADLPKSADEQGPEFCAQLGGADFVMMTAPNVIRGCLFVDGSAIDEASLLKGKDALSGTPLLALLTAKPLKPDPCMSASLPACPVACAPSQDDLCGAPCSGEASCARNMTGDDMSCKDGRWQCASEAADSANGCQLSCRWN